MPLEFSPEASVGWARHFPLEVSHAPQALRSRVRGSGHCSRATLHRDRQGRAGRRQGHAQAARDEQLFRRAVLLHRNPQGLARPQGKTKPRASPPSLLPGRRPLEPEEALGRFDHPDRPGKERLQGEDASTVRSAVGPVRLGQENLPEQPARTQADDVRDLYAQHQGLRQVRVLEGLLRAVPDQAAGAQRQEVDGGATVDACPTRQQAGSGTQAV